MEDRPKGLWPVYIDRALGHFSGQRLITFGGLKVMDEVKDL
eukprot:COSAG01_NODE_12262_length_1771_cov_1.269139_1_plen_40_part_10